jgi:hypothetical protein
MHPPILQLLLLTYLLAQIVKVIGYACQAIIILILFVPLLLYSIFESIFVELWRRYAPASHSPNRAPSSGRIFSLRAMNRRRLSISDEETGKGTTAAVAVVEKPKLRPRGFFDLPYELREQ